MTTTTIRQLALLRAICGVLLSREVSAAGAAVPGSGMVRQLREAAEVLLRDLEDANGPASTSRRML